MKEPATTNRYFALRHGSSQANEMGLVVSDLQRGRNAFGLTDQGREQVRASVIVARDQETLDHKTIVVSSPFRRTVESARIVTQVLGTNGFTCDDRLRERHFGSLELGSSSHYPTVWEQDRLDPGHTQWEVESVNAIATRVQALITDLDTQYVHQTILLVTHGDTAATLLCWAAGKDLSRHREIGALQTAEICEVHWAKM